MRLLRALGKSAVTTIVFFLIAEIALRALYFARNSFVEYVPLPYVVGDDYGPIPPWLDNLLILKPDAALIWKNLPNARRAYVDIFTPVWQDSDRMALLRRFAPWLPPAFRRNPVWRIALNDEGFRSAPIVAGKRAGVLRIAPVHRFPRMPSRSSRPRPSSPPRSRWRRCGSTTKDCNSCARVRTPRR